MSVTLYPELIDYIYENCSAFKTKDEILAGKTVLYNRFNQEKNRFVEFDKLNGMYSDAPHIQAIIANGYEEFKLNVVTRIYNEHKDELNLNLCPKCFKITRTPQAKQCRFCFYDWH